MLIYLSSPYSHETPAVRGARFTDAARVTGILTARGWFVFSPIVHSVPLVKVLSSDAFTTERLGTTWKDWEQLDQKWIDKCDALLVLPLWGVDTSIGVAAEKQYARSRGKLVGTLNMRWIDFGTGEPVHWEPADSSIPGFMKEIA